MIIPVDYSTGFGGKFGVQKDRVDKSAMGYAYREELSKHESQKGFYVLECYTKCNLLLSYIVCCIY